MIGIRCEYYSGLESSSIVGLGVIVVSLLMVSIALPISVCKVRSSLMDLSTRLTAVTRPPANSESSKRMIIFQVGIEVDVLYLAV